MIAKTTRPSTDGVLPPARLLRRLAESCERSVVWIAGPAGFGKTTLASCYVEHATVPCLWYQVDEGDNDLATFFYFLSQAAKNFIPNQPISLPLFTPEYALGVKAFASFFFEELVRQMNTSGLLVFDDYHRLSPNAPIHEILQNCFLPVQEGIKTIFISRNPPPAPLIGLQLSRQAAMICGDELPFTIEETAAVINSLVRKELSPSSIRNMYDKTLGWAAGLILLADKSKNFDHHFSGREALSGGGEVFDYFVSEIFTGIEETEREFLVKTSLFPKMTAQMANLLTGHHYADLILERLHYRHLFIQRHTGSELEYQYHPLFREFLLARGRELFDKKAWHELILQAANILEQAGKIEDAADLYLQAVDQDGLLRLIKANAATLFGQGRHNLVAEWFKGLPEEVLNKDPWLLFWLGTCYQPFNQVEAHRCFERSFYLFKERSDPAVLMAWSAVVDTICREWNDFRGLDPWIAMFDEIFDLEMISAPADSEVEGRVATSLATALTIREPQRPDLGDWLERGMTCARKSSDISFRIFNYTQTAFYFWWVGNFQQAQVVLKEISDFANDASATPLVKLTWIWLDACIDILRPVASDQVSEKVKQGLAYGNKHGVYVWHHMFFSVGAYSCLAQKDIHGAEKYLKQLATVLDGSRRHIYSQYHYLLCWLYLLRKEHNTALAHGQEACRVAEETGYVYPEILCRLALARVLLAQSRIGEAEKLASEMLTASRRTGSRLLEYSSLLLLVEIFIANDNESAGTDYLRKALRLAALNGYSSPPWWWDGPAMARLFVKALEHGIETGHVIHLIQQHRLVPEESPIHLEDWPWLVKIFSLGRFELVQNGKPLLTSGKAQQKPLALLKTLVSLGGRKISEAKLAELLWPDADGDMQRQSMKTTLHRLRQFLGDNEVLIFQDSQLTLNPRLCWVDVWAYERQLGEAETRWGADSGSHTAARLTDQALKLYNGAFLEHAADEYWSLPARERLCNKFLRGVRHLGRYYELHGRTAEAIALYYRGIEVDPLVEEFYQRQMICLKSASRKTEALVVYDRCCAALASAFGIDPSPETMKIRQEL